MRRHVTAMRDHSEPFARAYRLLEAQDVDGLREQLDRFPDLVAARGTNGNDLLGMAAATCDERLVALLLERGADPARANAHGWTPLHQAAYSGLPLLARLLLDAGAPADVSARGDGGTPLIVALFWGHGEVAELLAERGIFPRNLRAAAGLGRLDLIDELVTADGRLAPEAGAHRAFYRPHSGFPAWKPSDDRPEILDEALSWAARNDRVDALDSLVARGASVDADVNRGTALTWAAAGGRTRAILTLVALGADPNRRATFGGPEHGDGTTALHHAAEGEHLEAIRVLLDAGADPTVRDANYDATPADWAEHFGRDEARTCSTRPERSRRSGADTLGAVAANETYQARADSRRAKVLAATTSPFTIEVRFLGGLNARQRAAFTAAADRWTRAIVGDLPSVLVDNEAIDDVLILAQGTAIDVPGMILGQAGPTHLRPASAGAAAFLPAKGIMSFDTADLARMNAAGTLNDVITHEMGHVLGIGTVWEQKGLLQRAGSSNPTFSGPGAMEEYLTLRGGGRRRRVPVENTGGPGTRDGHWRETVFHNELMSGYISEPGNPLSRMTVASLADLGYQVDLDAGEPYELPDLLELAEAGELVERAAPIDGGTVLPVIPITLPAGSLQARPERRRSGR